jgi:hypothetical protein
MTRIFSDLANANGHPVEVDTVTRGGWILHDYLDVQNEQAEKIERLSKEGSFDFCVLQEQSLNPVVDFESFKDGVTRLMAKLSNAAQSFLLYETFGWEDGFEKLAARGLTWDTMARATTEAYSNLSRQIGVPVSRAGSNFCYVKRNRPDLDMFLPDHVHATYTGSCLIALTHYHTIFGELPRDNSALALPEDLIAYFLDVVAGNNGK